MDVISVHYRFFCVFTFFSLSLSLDRFYCEICTFDTGVSILIQKKNNQIYLFAWNCHLIFFFIWNRHHIIYLVCSMHTKSYNWNEKHVSFLAQDFKQFTSHYSSAYNNNNHKNLYRKTNRMQILRRRPERRQENWILQKEVLKCHCLLSTRLLSDLTLCRQWNFLSYHRSNRM